MRKLIIAAIMLLALGVNNSSIYAQSVTKNGNNFTQVTNNKKSGSKETKTQYTYTDSKGNTYHVWLSSGGKAFIKRISKKTGKEYKQYVPEIGKQINPQAYKEDKK